MEELPNVVSPVSDTVVNLLLEQNHIFLLLGILAFIFLLRTVKPVAIIFSTQWKWTITFINLALSFIGIFLFGLTSVTTAGSKVVVALVVSAFATFSYQFTKPVLAIVFKKLFGNVKPD